MKSNPYITRWINRIINILFTIAVIGVIHVLVQLFLIASFTILSNSMEPELMKGDRIWVWKPAIGARLFNIFASIKGKEVNIHRAPGMERIHRNDVLVFNYPYARWNKWDKMELYVLKYYIKRCIALPGDTLSIHNGIYQIGKSDLIVGNMESQKSIRTFDPEKLSPQQFYTLPFDTILQWNIEDFGPLYIP